MLHFSQSCQDDSARGGKHSKLDQGNREFYKCEHHLNLQMRASPQLTSSHPI